jgi:Fuc2NAc and GlcNAc transferase
MRYLAVLAVFLLALVATRTWTAVSIRLAIFDVPNVRSSHSAPTPRGAGVAILAAFLPVPLVACFLDRLDPSLAVSLCVGGLLVGAIGVLDDYRSIAPRWRLACQAVAAILAIASIGLPPELLQYSPSPWWYGIVWTITLLALLWHVNLFNFMDGIDGIAGAQGVFVAGAGAVLSSMHGEPPPTIVYACLAAACAGFLTWNWPPARVFMGDVGSGFLGFTLAVFALHSAAQGTLPVWTWVILMAAFIVDATVTFVRRLLRGERVYEAHRSHAYQWSARRAGSHAAITVSFALVNLLWLFPLAWLSAAHPAHAPAIALAATVPLVALACLRGAGRPERNGRG